MKKSKTVSPVTKFYRYKWSGPIIVFGVAGLILLGWNIYTDSLEFFDHFSCQGLIDYVTLDQDLGPDIPRHSELTEEQHNHLHEIIAPCIEKFSDIEP